MLKTDAKKTLQIDCIEFASPQFPDTVGDVIEVEAVEEMPRENRQEKPVYSAWRAKAADLATFAFVVGVLYLIVRGVVSLVYYAADLVGSIKISIPDGLPVGRMFGVFVVALLLGGLARAVGMKKFLPAFAVASLAVFVAAIVVKSVAFAVASKWFAVALVVALGVAAFGYLFSIVSRSRETARSEDVGRGNIVANIVIDAAGQVGDIIANIFIKK